MECRVYNSALTRPFPINFLALNYWILLICLFTFYKMMCRWTFTLVIIYFAVCSLNSSSFFFFGIDKVVYHLLSCYRKEEKNHKHLWFSIRPLRLNWDRCFQGNLRYVFLQIASVISAHGCWVYSKQHTTEHTTENDEANGFLNDDPEENPGERISRPNKNDDQIRFSGHHGQLLYEERAGFWGYLMQIIYQVRISTFFSSWIWNRSAK